MSIVKRSFLGIVGAMLMLGMTACQQTFVRHPHPMTQPVAEDSEGHYQAEGVASWYGRGFQGHRTASGKRFSARKLTAAHRILPFGTKLQVTNLNNNKTVIVEVTDRGPFIKGRLIDLSQAAAKKLGFAGAGVARVRLEEM